MTTSDFSGKTIIRRERNAANPYFMMARDVAQNKLLSYEALGLLAYFLSRPDNWQIQLEDLKRFRCGRDKTLSLIEELRKAGHMYLAADKQEHDAVGRFAPREWIVTEKPSTEKPVTVEPCTVITAAVQPSAVNPPLHSKEEIQSPESLNRDSEKEEIKALTEVAEESSAATVQNLDDAPQVYILEKPTPAQLGALMTRMHENVMALTPMVKDHVLDLLNDYGFKAVDFAIAESVVHNKRSLAYIEAVAKRVASQQGGDGYNKYLSGEYADFVQH